MVLNSVQRLAAMKGLDVDKVKGNARGSILNKQWPGGMMIYSIDPQIGKTSTVKHNSLKSISKATS